jgi:hypothetical protein
LRAATLHDRTAHQILRGFFRRGRTDFFDPLIRRFDSRGERPLQEKNGRQIRGDRVGHLRVVRIGGRAIFGYHGNFVEFISHRRRHIAVLDCARHGSTTPEKEEAKTRDDISVFPLAFPFIAGPGALATILLTSGELWGKPLQFAAFLGVVFLVMLVCWVLMLATPRLMKVFGVTGANVMSRLSGVILAALAVQFIVEGIRGSFLS